MKSKRKKNDNDISRNLTAREKYAILLANTDRLDPAGRSGMGEGATSNVARKTKGASSNAERTAAAAYNKVYDADPDKRPSRAKSKKTMAAYNKSLIGAQKYAGWREDPDRPGKYVSPPTPVKRWPQ
jgi:hypothetical protein